MKTVSGMRLLVSLPADLTIKRLTYGNDGMLYAYCDVATGGEATVQVSTDDDGHGHIEQVIRIGAIDG